jgi:DNA-binding helix-hairpin-helix protein with protein kinase domain
MTTGLQWFAGSTGPSSILLSDRIDYTIDIDRSSLYEIGQGAEGRVFGFQNDPSIVYKEYHLTEGHPPDAGALKRLIDLPKRWTAEEFSWIQDHTAWPQTAVFDGGILRGYLMRRIPDSFLRKHGVRNKPAEICCDWNYLSMRNRFLNNPNIFSEVPVPDTQNLLDLISSLARTIEILHRHDVVIGDLSGRNLLWTDTPSWQVLLIDCDGFRVRGVTSVNHAKQTPDWEDPALRSSVTTQSSDIYKLGLAAFRAIWAVSADHPTSPLQASPADVPNKIKDLISQSVGDSPRLTAAEWAASLSSSPVAVPIMDEASERFSDKPSAGSERKRPTILMKNC